MTSPFTSTCKGYRGRPADYTSNWPTVHRRYVREDKQFFVLFAPLDPKNLYDTIMAPPETPPGPIADMMVSGNTHGRIVSIQFWNIEAQPKEMIQLYDPFKDALMILFTDEAPEPELDLNWTPTFHDDILLYIEEGKVLGIVVLSASKSVVKSN